jgi:hypothetical protein
MAMMNEEEQPWTLAALYGVEAYVLDSRTQPIQWDTLAQRMGGSFCVIPCSAHIVLLCKDGRLNYASMQQAAERFDNKAPLPDMALPNKVYHYDAAGQLLELAKDYEARTAKYLCYQGK